MSAGSRAIKWAGIASDLQLLERAPGGELSDPEIFPIMTRAVSPPRQTDVSVADAVGQTTRSDREGPQHTKLRWQGWDEFRAVGTLNTVRHGL